MLGTLSRNKVSAIPIPTTMAEVEALYRNNHGIVYTAKDDGDIKLHDYDRTNVLDGEYTLLHVASGGNPYKGKLILVPNTLEANQAADRGTVMYLRDRYGIDKEVAAIFNKLIKDTKFGREQRVQDLAMSLVENAPADSVAHYKSLSALKEMGYDTFGCSNPRATSAIYIAGQLLGKRIIRYI